MIKGELTFATKTLDGKYKKGYHELNGLVKVSNCDDLHIYRAVGLDVGEHQATVYCEGLLDELVEGRG